jgi:hypothetical protein
MARKKNMGRTATAAFIGAGVGAAVLATANAIMPADTTGERGRAAVGGLLGGAVLGAVGGVVYSALARGHRAMNPATSVGAIGMGASIGAASIIGDHLRRSA